MNNYQATLQFIGDHLLCLIVALLIISPSFSFHWGSRNESDDE